jgi:hypothetical protein
VAPLYRGGVKRSQEIAGYRAGGEIWIDKAAISIIILLRLISVEVVLN